jgi:hypothetical protein
VEELDVVDGERVARGAEPDQAPDVVLDPAAPVVLEPRVVDRVDLLAAALRDVAVGVEEVVPVGELVPGQDLRDADGR